MSNPTPRVLYVDDDPALARLVQLSLGRRGYTVENVTSSAAGLARLRKGGIDLIALDHFLPIGTGLDFLEALTSVATSTTPADPGPKFQPPSSARLPSASPAASIR